MALPDKKAVRGRRGPVGLSAKDVLILNGDLPAGASDDDFRAFLLAQAAYVHTQASPASSWTINHNLGRRPFVSVLSSGGVEVEALVTHLNANQARVDFVTAYAGTARAF